MIGREEMDIYGAELAHKIWPLRRDAQPGRTLNNLSRSMTAIQAGVALLGYETGEDVTPLVEQRGHAADLADVLYGYIADHPSLSEDELRIAGELAQRLTESSRTSEGSVIHEAEPLHDIVFGMSDEALALASIRRVR